MGVVAVIGVALRKRGMILLPSFAHSVSVRPSPAILKRRNVNKNVNKPCSKIDIPGGDRVEELIVDGSTNFGFVSLDCDVQNIAQIVQHFSSLLGQFSLSPERIDHGGICFKF